LFIEGELLSGVVGVGWLFLLVVTAWDAGLALQKPTALHLPHYLTDWVY
jgi:hypothetical protein